MKKIIGTVIAAALLLTGCAKKPKETYDYSEFEKSKPSSILVTLPVNNSKEVNAASSVLARASFPLAEKGYYVFPVALVDEVFKQNGITNGHDIQTASIKKIHEIFGADAIMYLSVDEYGSSYQVFNSVTKVSVSGKLVDLRTGKTLWEGKGIASSQRDNSNNGILAVLVMAAVDQIVDTIKDKGYEVSASAVSHLFYVGEKGGVLNGPRYPKEVKK